MLILTLQENVGLPAKTGRMDFALNNKEKYYWNAICSDYVRPYFSMTDFLVVFEWDSISRTYRLAVSPWSEPGRRLHFYQVQHDKVDDAEMVIVYTRLDEYNFRNPRQLKFLLEHDDPHRFRRFYGEFIAELHTAGKGVTSPDYFSPLTLQIPPKES